MASLLRRVDVIQSHYAQESGLEDSLATVVRDSAEWERLWRRIDDRSGRTPRVDFGREMVLIYGLGRQFDMGGIQLEVESATLRGDTLVTVIRKTITLGDAMSATIRPIHPSRWRRRVNGPARCDSWCTR